MDETIVKKIFLQHGLGEVRSVRKIEIGFTNKVYHVNDRFILKVCEDVDNEESFGKEIFFYDFFKDKIPVPRVTIFDNSKSIYNKYFMIYLRIKGDNLYSKWHLLDNTKRKKIIKQLCEILKIINKSPYDEYLKKFETKLLARWHDKIINQTQNSLEIVEEKKLLSSEFIETIKNFIDSNHSVLVDQKIALVYWDAHFDNILVQDDRIVGILDFERTELSSIDFVLDIVKRMMKYPSKYMSKEFEKFAKKEDYAQLVDWFQEFYPELFEFDNLDRRLDLYTVEHDLRDVIGWPDVREVKQSLADTVGYRGIS